MIIGERPAGASRAERGPAVRVLYPPRKATNALLTRSPHHRTLVCLMRFTRERGRIAPVSTLRCAVALAGALAFSTTGLAGNGKGAHAGQTPTFGEMKDLGTLEGHNFSDATAANESGVVVGYSDFFDTSIDDFTDTQPV